MRAHRVDAALQMAWREELPVRVVICEGEMRHMTEDGAVTSKVERRLLDSLPWAVTSYDWITGRCTLTRGVRPGRFVDQFSLTNEAVAVDRRSVTGDVFVRSAQVRRSVLRRADGRCEWCECPGFMMSDGRVYLETHHIVPLSDGGPDTDDNVVGLCPNHHREAHHGKDKGVMRDKLRVRFERRGNS